MPDNTPAPLRRHGLVLGTAGFVAALVLGVVNLLTADRILAQQEAAERRALAEILPQEMHDNDLLKDTFVLTPESTAFISLELLGLTTERLAYPARMNKDFAGIILPLEVHNGYNGDIFLLVGIREDGTISGVRVLQHTETPGLGDKIDIGVSDWILSFDGRSLENPPPSRWRVVKDGGDFDQFVGATVTPRALVAGVYRALEFFSLNRESLDKQ
jgi:electron transport complex protein RnfG